MTWLLALVLVSPAPELRRCLLSCYVDREPVVCLYDEGPACLQECVESASLVCRPRVVNLGPWDPRPVEW